ncbi:1-acyl-sn-glycerol-3-phosphate acyltransferase alpha isoform X2 [Bacillus rossius redtenbacheri]|uniref:1-acyl-sn-glycerol-3-phosphate acyltransferase alpha isoform X2 n=1 Tax=Bacillus rossius redtenbacheri TaxID=93214 RepID=UPI002FDE834D
MASARCEKFNTGVVDVQVHLRPGRTQVGAAWPGLAGEATGMFEMWPVMEKCTVVAKKELFYAWPFGLAAWLCGLIFIDRLNTDQARQTINKATLNLKEKQIKMWVFPEGTRHNTGTIMPFKKGAFHVAIMGQIPVLPVVFSSYYFLNSETKEFNPGRIIVTALPPISTKSLTPQDVESLMNRTRECMLDVFDKTSAEVLTSTLPTPMYQ